MSSTASAVRVLIVHPRDPAAPTLGGIQTFLRDFIKYAPPDFEISFVGTTRDPDTRPVGKWLALQIGDRKVRYLAVATSDGPSRSPRAVARSVQGAALLWRALRERDRILQVHRPYRRVMLDRHAGPIVQLIHLDLRDWPGPQGWPKLRGLYREFSDATLERMDRVFIVNETGAIQLRADHPAIAERVEFLPVWYDADVFHEADDTQRERLRTALAGELGLPASAAQSHHFILFAARLTEIKKPLLAIDALSALDMPGAHLVVAGSGELADAARARATELGVAERVHFVGDLAREHLARYMRACDAFLLTARSEGGGPRVVLEALASGLPVVSTTVVEVKRTVTHGVNGWLVAEPSPQALADGLAWALAQPRPSIAAAATDAVKSFTAQRTLAHVYDTYRTLLSRSHGG